MSSHFRRDAPSIRDTPLASWQLSTYRRPRVRAFLAERGTGPLSPVRR
jgi:hypothetical protein